MKIAILVCGHVRTFRSCLEGFFTHLVREHDADVYLSLWNTISAVDSNNPVGAHEPTPIADVVAAYRPVGVVNEPRRFFDLRRPYWKRRRPETRLSPTFGMAYRVYMAKELLQQRQCNYDLVVRTRFDMLFRSPVELSVPPGLLLPDYRPYRDWDVVPGWPGVNTNFAAGTPAQMATYCDFYQHIEATWDRGVPFHPETLLGSYLVHEQVSIQRTPVDYTLARPPGYQDQPE